DSQRIRTAWPGIVFLQPRPEAPYLNPDNGVDAWIERCRTPEDLNAQHVFFQLACPSGVRFIYHISQEACQDWCMRESIASEDSFQLVTNLTGAAFVSPDGS